MLISGIQSQDAMSGHSGRVERRVVADDIEPCTRDLLTQPVERAYDACSILALPVEPHEKEPGIPQSRSPAGAT